MDGYSFEQVVEGFVITSDVLTSFTRGNNIPTVRGEGGVVLYDEQWCDAHLRRRSLEPQPGARVAFERIMDDEPDPNVHLGDWDCDQPDWPAGSH